MTTNTVTTTTVDEWLQFCQETLVDDDNGQAATPTEGFFGAISAFMRIPEASMNPRNSCTSNAQLSPKGILSKPIRRRSRVSKKTPITLLNANTSNFRALVQKFTGCPSKSTGSFAYQKGPITLNFEKGTGHLILQNQSNVMPGWSHHGSAVHQSLAQLQQLQQHQQKQLECQPQEATFSQENSCSNIFPCALTSYQTSMDISDHGFIFGDHINLQEKTLSSFTIDDHVNDDGYFM